MSLPTSERFVRLEQHIRHSIRGQDHVIPAVVERVTIGESSLASPDRPKGSFIFLGPTGVGKTKLARLLSHTLYDGIEPFRLDMAEFKAEDALVKFIGRPHRAARTARQYPHPAPSRRYFGRRN